MKNLGAYCSILVSCFALFGCNAVFKRMDDRAESRAVEVMMDLRKNRESSRYYRNSDKWIGVTKDVRIITSDSWRVSYYQAPLGPFKVFDVETGEVHFEE